MAERQEAPGRLELLRGFVNTLDREEGREALADPDALRGWLIEAGLADTALSVRPADLRRAIAVREALRAVLLAHNGAALVDDGAAGDAGRGGDTRRGSEARTRAPSLRRGVRSVART